MGVACPPHENPSCGRVNSLHSKLISSNSVQCYGLPALSVPCYGLPALSVPCYGLPALSVYVRTCTCLWHWGDVDCVSVEGELGGCSTSLLHYIVPRLCKILPTYVRIEYCHGVLSVVPSYTVDASMNIVRNAAIIHIQLHTTTTL